MKNNTKIYNRFKGFTLEDCDCRYCLYYGCLLYTSKEADRAEPALSKEKSKTPEPNRQTVHTQPKKHKKSKKR